jgi:NAD(P)-dependent dehydrogenase (short-subunit alcohol dehydrogenase family)
LGGIDILVNNAAHQATFKDIGDISDEEWQMTFEVNIHSMFYLTKAAVPHMKPGSAVINTASVNSDMPNPILLAYATTKGAIQNFTGGLAQLLAQKGIRASAVAPGPIRREEFWQTGPLAAGRATGGTSNGVCHAGRSTLKLHIRNYCCGHRWQAVHLGGDLSGNLTAYPNGTFAKSFNYVPSTIRE